MWTSVDRCWLTASSRTRTAGGVSTSMAAGAGTSRPHSSPAVRPEAQQASPTAKHTASTACWRQGRTPARPYNPPPHGDPVAAVESGADGPFGDARRSGLPAGDQHPLRPLQPCHGLLGVHFPRMARG